MTIGRFHFYNFPKIWVRWFTHFLWIFFPKRFSNPFPPASFIEWWMDGFFYTLDVLYFPFWYESMTRVFKNSVRKLTLQEKMEAQIIFGDNLTYDCIRVDTNPALGVSKDVLAYVTFFTVNCKGKLPMSIFIHELVHVWQYQQFGSVYIAKAIKAQRSREGYDFGGVQGLYQEMIKGKTLLHFNFEQQAEIIESYYSMLKNGKQIPLEESVLKYFVELVFYRDSSQERMV